MSTSALQHLARHGVERLAEEDPELHDLLSREYRRQANVLTMVASTSITDASVMACEGTIASNVTAEGYPGARFHAGCSVVDEIERLAIERAKAAFGARYANVQPLSASIANEVVLFGLLSADDVLLGMELDSGGHLTHGAAASISGQYFVAEGYGLTPEGAIDYAQVRRLAHERQPKLIICGTTAYPRIIDFKQFREIADEVGAYLLADVSQIAGLIVAGLHPSPIDDAHFTTSCTHKQLFGCRGGLILMGRDFDSPGPDGKRTLAQLVQRWVFPFLQGAPNLNLIAAKARTLARVLTPDFRELAQRIVDDARALAERVMARGYPVVANGTENHLVVVDVLSQGLTGLVAERALEDCDIIVNKNRIPHDRKSPVVTSGIRFGTNALASRGMGTSEMHQCADLVHQVLRAVKAKGDREFDLDSETRTSVKAAVAELCRRFPLPSYLTN